MTPIPAVKMTAQLAHGVEAPVAGQNRGDDVGHGCFALRLRKVTRRHVLMDRRIGIAVARHVQGAENQQRAGRDHGQQRNYLEPSRRRFFPVRGQRQCGEHQHGHDATADRGLGEGHVDRIQRHEQPGREQRIDAAQHDHGEEVPQPQDAERYDRQERQQHDVDQGFYGASSLFPDVPSLSSGATPRR